MPVDTLALPLATDVVGGLEKRLLASFAAAAEEWSELASALTDWEDEHLLDDPAPEMLNRHKATNLQLINLGKILSAASSHPEFSNPRLSRMISATQQMLQDKLIMWHTELPEENREQIIRSCFP